MKRIIRFLLLMLLSGFVIQCQLNPSAVKQLEDTTGPEIKLSNQDGYSFTGELLIIEGVVRDKDNNGGAGKVQDISLYIGPELKAKARISNNGAFYIRYNIYGKKYPLIARLEAKDWNNNITVKALTIYGDIKPFTNFKVEIEHGKFNFNWVQEENGEYRLCYTVDNIEPSEHYSDGEVDDFRPGSQIDENDLRIQTGRLYKFRLLYEKDGEKLERSLVHTVLPLTEHTLIPILLPGIREIKLQWPAIAEDIQFDVYKSESITGPYRKIAENLTKNQYIDKRVTPETTYYYKIGVSHYSTVQSVPVSGQCSENLMSERFISYPVYSADSYAIELWGDNSILMLSKENDFTYYLSLIDRTGLTFFNNYIGEPLKLEMDVFVEGEKDFDLYVEGDRAFLYSHEQIYEIFRNSDKESGLEIKFIYRIQDSSSKQIESLIINNNYLYIAITHNNSIKIEQLVVDEENNCIIDKTLTIGHEIDFGDIVQWSNTKVGTVLVCHKKISIINLSSLFIMKSLNLFDIIGDNEGILTNRNFKFQKIIITNDKVYGLVGTLESISNEITGMVFRTEINDILLYNKLSTSPSPVLINNPVDMAISSNGNSIIVVANDEEKNSSTISIYKYDQDSNLLNFDSQVRTNQTGVKSVMSEIKLTDNFLYSAYGVYGLSRFSLDSDDFIFKYKKVDIKFPGYDSFRVINYGEKTYLFSNHKSDSRSVISIFSFQGYNHINTEKPLELDEFGIVEINHIGSSVYILASNRNVYKLSLPLGTITKVYEASSKYSNIYVFKDYLILSNSEKLLAFSLFDNKEKDIGNMSESISRITSITKVPEGLLVISDMRTRLLRENDSGLELEDVPNDNDIMNISYGNSGIIAFNGNSIDVYTEAALGNYSSPSMGEPVSFPVDLEFNSENSGIKKIQSIGDYSSFLHSQYGLNIMWANGVLFNLSHTINWRNNSGDIEIRCKDYNIYGDLIFMAYDSGLCIQELKK